MSTTTTTLGKVVCTPKGTWSDSTAYEKLDIVTNGGSSYLAIQNVPAGTSLSSTSYWLMIASKGDTGDTGAKGDTGSAGAAGNGIASVVKTGTSGLVDTYTITFTNSTTTSFTVVNGADGDTVNIARQFSTGSTYAVGDYAIYSGDLYRCIVAVTTAGEWSSANWTHVALADDVSDLRRQFDVVRNEALDPEFTDITSSDNFAFQYWSSKTVENGVLTTTKNSSGQAKTTIKTATLTSKNITYCSIWVKVIPSNGTVTSDVYVNCAGYDYTFTQDDYNVWVKKSFIGAVNSSNQISVGIKNSNTSPQYTIQIKRPFIVDMTSYFGKGNELTLAEADRFFACIENQVNLRQVYVPKNNQRFESRLENIVAENIWSVGNYFSPAAFDTNKSNNWWHSFEWSETVRTKTGDGSKINISVGGQVSNPSGSYEALVNTEVGDLYYMAGMLKTDTDFEYIRVTADNHWDTTKKCTDYTGEKNTWLYVSHIFTVTNVQYPTFVIVYADAATQNGAVLEYKCGMGINLTKTFGKGNEPSKEQMEVLLSIFDGHWFTGRRKLFSAEIIRFLNSRMAIDPKYNSRYGFDDYGAFLCKTHVDNSWPDWSNGRYNYGINAYKTNIYSRFDHSIVSDGMFISDGKIGAWSSGASDSTAYGGHVFQGWNEIGTYRLSLMIGNTKVGGTPREDEAAILVYSPDSCFSNPSQPLTEWQTEHRMTPASRDYYGGNSNLILGRIRIGSDLHAEGLLCERKRFTHFGTIVQTDDGVTFRKLVFNNDGTVTWTDCTSEMNDPS